ncbi:MAG TPA: hypothetical protein VK666_23185 [Chryseolinea sp.]|nr:hypothetical protein [Chryseolinea sp.]
MKKQQPANWFITVTLLCIVSSFAPVEHGIYVQLQPGSIKKVVIQIVPDKTYEHVVAHLNFYGANNKRVGQKAFSLTDEKDKYIQKDKCTTKTFKFSFDQTVTRVTIDHVSQGETLKGDDIVTKGTKLNLPTSTSALGPVEK